MIIRRRLPSPRNVRSALLDGESTGHAELGVPRDVTDVLILAGLLEGHRERVALARGNHLAGLDLLDVEVVQGVALVDRLEDVLDTLLVRPGERKLEMEVDHRDGDVLGHLLRGRRLLGGRRRGSNRGVEAAGDDGDREHDADLLLHEMTLLGRLKYFTWAFYFGR